MPLIVAGATLACILTGVTPAYATFPGRNGLIAFQAQATADAHIEIYTVRQNGHDLRQITHLDADAIRPDWSPDGRQIVFEIDRSEAPFCGIALMNADGTDIVELTPPQNLCENDPSFTPAGRGLSSTGSTALTRHSGLWISPATIGNALATVAPILMCLRTARSSASSPSQISHSKRRSLPPTSTAVTCSSLPRSASVWRSSRIGHRTAVTSSSLRMVSVIPQESRQTSPRSAQTERTCVS